MANAKHKISAQVAFWSHLIMKAGRILSEGCGELLGIVRENIVLHRK